MKFKGDALQARRKRHDVIQKLPDLLEHWPGVRVSVKSHQGHSSGYVNLVHIIEVKVAEIVSGVEAVIYRVGVEVVKVEQYAALCPAAEFIEEILFRKRLVAIANVINI